MLHEIHILINGLPVLIYKHADYRDEKNTEESENDVGKKSEVPRSSVIPEDKISLISGFFTAMNSFAVNMGDLGELKELEMANNIKFIFYKPSAAEHVMFIAISDGEEDYESISPLLHEMAVEFLQRYTNVAVKKWSGNTEEFTDFIGVIINKLERYGYIKRERDGDERNISENITEMDVNITADSVLPDPEVNVYSASGRSPDRFVRGTLSKNIADTHLKSGKGRWRSYSGYGNGKRVPYSGDIFMKLIPIPNGDCRSVNVPFGGESRRIFGYIDGRKSLEEIARVSGVPPERVINFCKFFIKYGLVTMTAERPYGR